MTGTGVNPCHDWQYGGAVDGRCKRCDEPAESHVDVAEVLHGDFVRRDGSHASTYVVKLDDKAIIAYWRQQYEQARAEVERLAEDLRAAGRPVRRDPRAAYPS